jgi:hypothetical protein
LSTVFGSSLIEIIGNCFSIRRTSTASSKNTVGRDQSGEQTKRTVEFRDNGDIVIITERSRDMIHEGTVLLTEQEADEAAHWGWKRIGGHPADPMVRVRRQPTKPIGEPS